MGRNIVLNLRSNVVDDNGNAKLPTAEQLSFGEIAVNYAKGNETLSIKNDNNEIVEFSNKTATKIAECSGLISDGIINYTPKEDAEYISQSTSLKNATEILDDAIKNLKEEVIKDEKVSAASIIALANYAGLVTSDGSIGFQEKESTNYITTAASLYNAIVILDAKIKELSDKIG